MRAGWLKYIQAAYAVRPASAAGHFDCGWRRVMMCCFSCCQRGWFLQWILTRIAVSTFDIMSIIAKNNSNNSRIMRIIVRKLHRSRASSSIYSFLDDPLNWLGKWKCCAFSCSGYVAFFVHLNPAQILEIIRIIEKIMHIIVLKKQLLFPYVQHAHLSDTQPVSLCNGQWNIGAQVQYLCRQALTNWTPAT